MGDVVSQVELLKLHRVHVMPLDPGSGAGSGGPPCANEARASL